MFLENKQEIELHNYEQRKILNRLVRKPGKNFAELFDNLKLLKGNIEVQVAVVRLVVKESLRFKRRALADLLENHIKCLLQPEK